MPGGVPAKDFAAFTMARFPGIETLATGELGRLMVTPGSRGTPLLVALLSAAYELGAGRLGADLAFLNCAPPLVRLYRRLGARPYDGRLVATPDGAEVPMVLVMSDVDEMERVGSFFAPLARRHFGPGRREPLDVRPLAPLFEDRRLPLEDDPLAVAARLERHMRDCCLTDLLGAETVSSLSAEGMVLALRPGDLLTEKGLGQRDLYFVLDGLFEAVDAGRRIRVLSEGDVAGEVAFFSSSGRRTASVRAVTEGRVFVLRHGALRRLRERDPRAAAELLLHLARALADRVAA